MLSNKNNLRSELTANVGVLATSISITAWEWVLWENNMVACLEHYENDICTKREVIKITAKNNDTFTITRWFADCIMNDQTKQQGHGSQEFVVGDYLSLYLSKEIWESLTVWITTNETNIQTMVARINAPKTCINDNCQDWKNAIDTAYVTKFGGVAGFGTGADGDVVISQDTFLDAGREYNFNNLTILEWVTVRFQGVWTPTINVWNNFKNFGTIDLRAPYLQARTDSQTDHWLHNWTAVANQSDSLTWIASEWWLYNGWAWWWWTSAWSDASDGHGGNGWSGAPYDWINGWAGWTSGSYWTGGWWAFGMWTGWRGWNGSCGWWNGWNWFYGWRWWDVTMRSRFDGGWWAGWKWVIRWWDAGWWTGWCDYNTLWNGGDAITNVYGLHLNARNIWNNLVDASGWDGGNGWIYYWSGTSWWYAPSGWNGGNGANGWQILVSYDTIHEQWCFDVSGWKGWIGAKMWFSSETYWRYEQPNGTDWTAGWVVFRSLNNPYIQNFNLENDEDNEAILISWKDPSFKPSNPQQWAKTVVRYSTSNYPTTPTDWTLAVEETTRDLYETNPYSLTGVLDETTYYFTAFAIDQNNNIIDSQTSSITTDFWWHVTPNTLFYINLDQSDWVFTDKKWHAVTNNWIQYSANGVVKGAWYNNQNLKRIIASFNNGETFPTQFTIMCFMKPTWNSRSSDHPMWIALSNANSKVVWWIWFNQTNTQVMFNHLRENVAWDSYTVSFSPLNTRHHYALTFDWSTMIWYIDWVQKISRSVSWSGSWTPVPTQWLTLFWRYITWKETDTNLSNVIQWYVDEAIAENRVWAQSEIQNYLQKIWFIS